MSTPALGIDVGRVRVGVAGSDPTGSIATPLAVLPRQPPARLWPPLLGLIAERQPALLVVGLPLRLDGGEGDVAADARSFAAELERRTGLPVQLRDERFTTAAAERSLVAQGTRRAARRNTVDSVAAALLLQAWLDSRRRPAVVPRPRPAPGRQGERGRLGIVFALVAVLMVVLAGAGGLFLYGRSQLDAPSATRTAAVSVTVRQGESLDSVVADLAAKGVIRSSFWFGWYAKLQGLGSHLVAGTFQLDRGMSASYIVRTLEGPPLVQYHKLLLTEGLTAEQMASRVAAAGLGITAQQYLDEVKHGSFSEPFLAGRPAGASLEGFLFPDTYSIPDKATAHDVIELQLQDFARKALPAFGNVSPQQLYRTLIIASIVESEARFSADHALVASVIDNRLAANYPLEVDSTVIYGLGLTSDVLTQQELQQDTPYNTYIHAGLPPTPISNPGLISIDAALHPATTDYFFFVSDGCGHNHYSVTAAQHQQQVNQYLGQPCASPSP
ncbi:MAG: endolytic transglycosylase MltG [Candidatus Dormibacteria bacterium]